MFVCNITPGGGGGGGGRGGDNFCEFLLASVEVIAFEIIILKRLKKKICSLRSKLEEQIVSFRIDFQPKLKLTE